MRKRNIFILIFISVIAFLYGISNILMRPRQKYLNLSEISDQIKKGNRQQESAGSVSSSISVGSISQPAATATYSTYDDLIKKLQSNDICNFVPENYKMSDRIKALLNGPDVIKINPDIDKTIFSLFNDGPLDIKNRQSKNSSSEFDGVLELYNAFYNAGLIQNYSRYSPPDYDRADQTLLYLENNYPNNGVFPLTRAYVLKQLGASEREISSELMRTIEAPEFNTYLQTITSRLLQKSFSNPTYYALAFSITSIMPIPNLGEPFKLLREHIKNENYDEFISKAEAFAYRIRPQNIPPGGKYEFFHWDALLYSHSNLLIKTIWSVSHFDEKMPELKKLTDLIANQQNEADLKLYEGWIKKTNCNRDGFERLVLRETRDYLNYLKTYGAKN